MIDQKKRHTTTVYLYKFGALIARYLQHLYIHTVRFTVANWGEETQTTKTFGVKFIQIMQNENLLCVQSEHSGSSRIEHPCPWL